MTAGAMATMNDASLPSLATTIPVDHSPFSYFLGLLQRKHPPAKAPTAVDSWARPSPSLRTSVSHSLKEGYHLPDKVFFSHTQYI